MVLEASDGGLVAFSLVVGDVLLLRNHLNLSLDVSEVSLQKLLSLVAARLIDPNCNVQVCILRNWSLHKSWFEVMSWWTVSFCTCISNKDDGHVNNRQQNISEAIDLLPRLAAGIDVNVHLRK